MSPCFLWHHIFTDANNRPHSAVKFVLEIRWRRLRINSVEMSSNSWPKLYSSFVIMGTLPADFQPHENSHDDVIKMETFSALLALCAGNSPVPVNSPHKGQWRGALMFSLIYAWINHWVNNREAGDLRRYRGHYDVTVMICGACQV